MVLGLPRTRRKVSVVINEFRCSILEREGRQDHYPNCEEVRYRKHESHYFQAKGIKITEVSVSRLEFPISGGDKQVLITTNSASINALITGEKDIKGVIKAFTTASGLNIDVMILGLIMVSLVIRVLKTRSRFR